MSLSERDLFIWHKRPIYMAKEAYGNEHTPRVLPQNLHPRRQHNRMVVELQYCRRGFASVYMYRGFLM